MHSKKRLIAILILVLLVSQIPFACRRYKLRRLNAAIQQLASERTTHEREAFSEHVGVVHVHSFLGGHSAGTFQEIISAARANRLHFVIMTEHPEEHIDTAAMTLSGMLGGVLFINGSELSAANGDRTLKLSDEISIAAYPEEFKDWATPDLDGVEVYNVFTNARRVNPIIAFFDVVWSQRAYPELIFAHYFQRPDEGLKKWDQALVQRRLIAVGGNDAHSNIGLSLKDSSGKTLVGLQLDPYETSFRLVRLHALIEKNRPLDPPSLLSALQAGHCFIGFDFLGDSSGFSFEAESAGEKKIQGDEITLQQGTRLRIRTPVSSRIVVMKDGAVFLDESGINTKELAINERGVYRVEVYLPQLGPIVDQKPWIISNPIYVR
jgi:hypothetical protein